MLIQQIIDDLRQNKDAHHIVVMLRNGRTLRGSYIMQRYGLAICTTIHRDGENWNEAWRVPLSEIVAIQPDFDCAYGEE